MPGELVESLAATGETSAEFHSFSITTATVIDNIDSTGAMRVQVRIPWLPNMEPWVRVAVLMAGPKRGTFFIPQVDDEVLVAFNQGDIRESCVIGCVWNGVDEPPTKEAKDAVSKRIIRTPKGLEILFDDDIPSITLTIRPQNQAKQNSKSTGAAGKQNKNSNDATPVITFDNKKIVIRRVSGSKQDDPQQTITLDDKGISFEAKKGDILLRAPQGKIRHEAKSLEQKSSSRTEIKSDGDCTINGRMVKIN